MGSNCKLIGFAAALIFFHVAADNNYNNKAETKLESKKDTKAEADIKEESNTPSKKQEVVKTEVQKHIAKKHDDLYYKKQIADFFTSIECVEVKFSQFNEGKKVGDGQIEFDRRKDHPKFIRIETWIGKRQFILTGTSLDKIEFEDVYLEEKKNIQAPEIVKLLFGGKDDVAKILKNSAITVTKDSKLVCSVKYDDFTGNHKILLCFNLKPFTLTFWRVINRDQTKAYIKVDSLRYNYKT